ncbi:MAG TPA: methyltransferase domain-containing protein [Acidimicrobiia bacterium]|nr:methyltransferase domain-containing protein [Acidimicrobiia bacterium]
MTYDSRRYAVVNRWDSTHLDKVDRLLDLQPGEKVLEVGCGAGHLTNRLAARGVDVIGIDANPNASEIAGTDRVRTMRAEALDFADDAFDAIVSVHAIEHIPQLGAALGEMARVLRPGGRAMFIYPAEPIMGMYAIPTSVILYRNPLRAREVHCQKLWPSKLRRMVDPFGWIETHREFNLLKSPQFVSRFVASV